MDDGLWNTHGEVGKGAGKKVYVSVTELVMPVSGYLVVVAWVTAATGLGGVESSLRAEANQNVLAPPLGPVYGSCTLPKR